MKSKRMCSLLAGLLLCNMASAAGTPVDSHNWWDNAWWNDSQIEVPENHAVATEWSSYMSG
ncbi:MAG: hypothetical protein OEX75_05965, partial [Gammaproteobacteria bacterium]|nr:hypothetical protein [Gammaproteobacteria bacterium]